MRTNRRLLFAALFLALFGGIFWLVAVPREPPEPMYQGKPLSFWLRGFDRPVNTTAVNLPAILAADSAVQEAGTNSIPTLLRLLKARDSRAKIMVLRLLQKQHYIKSPIESATTRNIEAFYGLLALGTNALVALPDLIQIYDENTNAPAADLIPMIMRAEANNCGALLRQAAISSDEAGRSNALRTLDLMGIPRNRVEYELVSCLNDPSPGIRAQAVNALPGLCRNDPLSHDTLRALTNMLNDPDLAVRVSATNAIAKYGDPLPPSYYP